MVGLADDDGVPAVGHQPGQRQVDAVDEGAWLSPGLADRLALALLDGKGVDGGADAVATRYGEARLDASRVLAEASPATVATGIDLRTVGAGRTGPDDYRAYAISLEQGRRAPQAPTRVVATGQVPG